MNKTIFISFPMRSHSKEQIIETFNNYKSALEKLGFAIVDSIITPDPSILDSSANIDIYYLGRSIETLSNCNYVYFAKGWEHSRGCVIEHQVAVNYGLNCLYE